MGFLKRMVKEALRELFEDDGLLDRLVEAIVNELLDRARDELNNEEDDA